MKTVVVLGASYGGTRAAQILAQELPQDWRVVLIDRNTHFNHLYVLPRCAILPQHAHKAFIPYTGIFRGPARNEEVAADARRTILLHAQVTALSSHSVTLSRSFPEYGIDGPVLSFDYAVYALGSHLPAPINLWGPCPDVKDPSVYRGCKVEGVSWLRKFHDAIEQAPSVLVVGGGALGIQYASDIAEVFPKKSVTLLHSRPQLLPRFDAAMHEEIVSALESLNVKMVLGERLDMASLAASSEDKHGRAVRTVRTQSGREISAGVVLLCTGQSPNTGMMEALLPESIVADGPFKGMIRVKRTMQVAVPNDERADAGVNPAACVGMSAPREQGEDNENESDDGDDESDDDDDDDADLSVPFPHLFAIGDAADAYGAIKAGHTAYYQGEIAARNIVQLIADPTATLQRYKPGAPAIKISLGLNKALYEVDGVVGEKSDVSEDLDAPLMWKLCGVDTDEDGMYL